MGRGFTRVGYAIPLNEALRRIRETLGWEVKRMAQELGMAPLSLSGREAGKDPVSVALIERVRDLTGLDPYVLAYCLFVDHSALPAPVQEKLDALKDEWMKQLDIMRQCRHKIPGRWW